MTITASASSTVAAAPRDILELVLDLDRYRLVDTKIVRVFAVEGPDDEGRGAASLLGRVKGFPPAPDRQLFTLERWSRLTFVGAPRHPARLVFDFTGVFECEPAEPGATLVRHSYEFRFKGPFRLAERRLGPWLQQEVEHEVERLSAALAPLG